MFTILLVEDSPGDQKLFEEALKEDNVDCRLLLASSANASIDMIFSQRPNLIVMDIHMPGISGEDFVLLLQNNPAAKFIPVIFLTGRKEMVLDSPEGISIGDKIYPLLCKPVNPQDLKEAISLALRKAD